MHTETWVYIHRHTYTHGHTHRHIYIHTFIHTYTQVDIHTYMNTHVHTHTGHGFCSALFFICSCSIIPRHLLRFLCLELDPYHPRCLGKSYTFSRLNFIHFFQRKAPMSHPHPASGHARVYTHTQAGAHTQAPLGARDSPIRAFLTPSVPLAVPRPLVGCRPSAAATL